MQASKTEYFNRYNYILKQALNHSYSFPADLCNFLVNEYDLDYCVLFRHNEENNFHTLGRSDAAKKIYDLNSVFSCQECSNLCKVTQKASFEIHNSCTIQISEFIIYEGSLALNVNSGEKYLLKIGKKSPFTKADRDNIELLGEYIITLLNIWDGSKGRGNKDLSQVITDIAHELRTPTNSIMGFASLLHEDNLTSSQAEYVSTLKESAYNLLSLINDLIELAKIDTGISKEVYTSVNIKNFIDDVIKLFNEKTEKNRIEFLTSIEKELPETIRTDGQKLRFILNNVLTYALRLTERGRISISVSPAPRNRILFKVTDSGLGIPSSKIKSIFDPFVITELSSSRSGTATGLVLTLSKRYAELLQ